METEMMTGTRGGSAGKRPRIPMGTPISARANKIQKVIVMKICNNDVLSVVGKCEICNIVN